MPLCVAFNGSAGAQTQLLLLCVANTLASAPLPQPSFFFGNPGEIVKKKKLHLQTYNKTICIINSKQTSFFLERYKMNLYKS